MSLRQKITIFNPDTGLIVDQREKGLYNPFDPDKGYNFKYKSHSIKSYLDIPLPDGFNDSEIGKLHRLSKLIYADSNLLGRRSNNSVKPLSQSDIIQVFKLKERQGKTLLRKLIKHRIIRKLEIVEQGQKQTQYYVNPIYFFSGTYLNLNLFLLFQDQLCEYLPDWVVIKFLEQANSTNLSN